MRDGRGRTRFCGRRAASCTLVKRSKRFESTGSVGGPRYHRAGGQDERDEKEFAVTNCQLLKCRRLEFSFHSISSLSMPNLTTVETRRFSLKIQMSTMKG